MTQIEDKKAKLAQLEQAHGQRSKTKQSYKAQHNINNIMAEFQKTGIMPLLKEHPGHSQINPSAGLDYHQALSIIRQQQQSNYDGSFQPDIPAKKIYKVRKGDMPFNP